MRLASSLSVFAACLWLAGCVTEPCLGACPSGTVCDEARSACVPDPAKSGSCAADADCPLAERARCAPSVRRCVACLTDGDCPAGRCNRTTFTCAAVGCASSTDCVAVIGRPFCSAAGACVACLADVDCPSVNGLAGVCSRADNTCRDAGCRSDLDCAPGRCDTSERLCIACLDVGDCAFGGTCLDGACVPTPGCTAPADCPWPLACTSGACVACTTAADCRSGQLCTDGACAEPESCGADEACLAGRVCVAGRCSDAACQPDAFEPDDDVSSARVVDRSRVPVVSAWLCPNDVDTYLYDLYDGEGATVVVTFDAAKAPPRLTILTGPSGIAVTTTSPVPGKLLAVVESAPAGTRALLVRVDGHPGALALDYTLSVEVASSGTCANDAREPNDSQEQAVAVAPGAQTGVACPQDQDWYAVEVPRGDHVVATLQLLDGARPGEAALEIFALDDDDELRQVAYGLAAASQPNSPAEDAEVWVRVSNPQKRRKLRYVLGIDVRPLPPANDVCAARTTLVANATTPGSLRAAADDAVSACGGGTGDVFYDLVLAVPSRVRVLADGPFPVSLSLSTSCEGASFACLADATAGALDVEALPAGRYVLQVEGPAGAGAFGLSTVVTPVSPPSAGEVCGSPTLMDLSAGKVAITGSVALAADDVEASCGRGGGDVVYGWMQPEPRRLKLRLAAFPGASFTLAPEAACGAGGVCRVAGANGLAEVDLPWEAPGEWRVVIDGGRWTGGSYALDVELLPAIAPPQNDLCEGATELESVATGDTRGAADDVSPLCSGAPGGGRDVVYRFSLAEERDVELNLDADFDGTLSLASGTCVSEVATSCADGPGARLVEPALPAGDYLVRVDGWGPSSGTFTLSRATRPPEPMPDNDLCTAATVLTPIDGTAIVSGSTRRARADLSPSDCRDGAGPLALDGAEVVYAVDVPAGGRVEVSLVPAAGFDAALYALDACGTQVCVAASDRSFLGGGAEALSLTNATGAVQRRLVVVDAWQPGASGAFTLTATVAP
ncbi:MAG: hypothetical protein RL199_773 [Pseudomonadota bacterium]|jgi:hypothetical protein